MGGTQAVWVTDSVLRQLPHITPEALERASEHELEAIADIIDCEDDVRDKVLRLNPQQMADVARYCNRYPSVDVSFEVEDADDVHAGSPVLITVLLERDDEDEEEEEEEEDTAIGPVIAPFFPQRKEEAWWCVIGDAKTNKLLGIKRVMLQKRAQIKLDGVCDSYLGCDAEVSVELDVKEPEEMDSSS